MSDLRIAVVIASTREGRLGDQVGEWVFEQAKDRDASYELIDLKAERLPIFDSAKSPGMGYYQDDTVKAWGEKIASFDGFIFVTPEYNHAIPAPLKNAIDLLGPDWNNKSCAFVGYGGLGGARAIENLRAIAGFIGLADVSQTLTFTLFGDFKDFSKFTPVEQNVPAAQTMFDQVEAWAGALKPLR